MISVRTFRGGEQIMASTRSVTEHTEVIIAELNTRKVQFRHDSATHKLHQLMTIYVHYLVESFVLYIVLFISRYSFVLEFCRIWRKNEMNVSKIKLFNSI